MREGKTLLIGDAWVGAGSGAVIETLDPSDGTVAGTVSCAGSAEVDAAVERAQAAFADPSWRRMAPAERARLLWRLADRLEANGEELAVMETRDQGQPVGIVRAVGVPMAAEQLRYCAGWATKLDGATTDVSFPDALHYTRREPLGVLALLPTWNFPLMSAAGKLAPALAAGNTVVLKPADYTPLTAVRLSELAVEVGFPPGVVNCITGDAETSRLLVAHPGVAGISFTGSTVVGRDIEARTAGQFKRLTLELGGKAASIVMPDADIDAAVLGNLQGALLNSGQVCAAYTRFFVHRSRLDEFVTKAAGGAAAMKLGPGLDPETQLGPLVSERQVQRVAGYVAGAVEQGAELVTGGERPNGALEGGSYYPPTLFNGVQDSMTIAQEEVFGPVMSVLAFDDADEVVARANSSEYGLSACVWSRDIAVAHRMAADLDVGTIHVNMQPVLDAAAPWGGYKASGKGKEMGASGVLECTREKAVWVNLA